MAREITLPQLGEGIEAGDVVNVLVAVGDSVEKDQALAEIETDKAVVELPSPERGRIARIAIKAGDHVKVGAVLFDLEPFDGAAPQAKAPGAQGSAAQGKGETGKAAVAEAPKAAKASPPAPGRASARIEVVRLPALGEGVESGDVVNVLVKAGDALAKDQPIAEIETDKAVAEVPSPVAGRVAAVLVRAGEKVRPGAELLKVEVQGEGGGAERAAPVAAVKAERPVADAPVPAAVAPKAPLVREAAVATGGRLIPAGPATRRFARELGVDLARVTGSGPGGRIQIEDVKAFVRSGASAAGPAGPVAAPALPDFSQWGPIERKPVSSLRRKIAEQMALAWAAPMVTQFDEADVTDLDAFRKQYAPQIKEAGGALTITVFALKAVIEALKEFPQFNASFDAARGELILKKYYHIAVAVDTPAGLIVPVVRDADRKSLRALAIELNQIAARARERKVSVEELQGGTFTISNLGGIGGTGFTPLLNPPQVAILGIARGAMRPVWRDGRFEPRLITPISVTYDHRVVDGADGARFARRVARGFEEFAGVVLDV